MRPLTLLQAAAAVVVLARLARGRARRPPLRLGEAATAGPKISVVVPARDEERRLGPCLDGLMADGDLREVIVVDDESRDATAELAALFAFMVAGVFLVAAPSFLVGDDPDDSFPPAPPG